MPPAAPLHQCCFVGREIMLPFRGIFHCAFLAQSPIIGRQFLRDVTNGDKRKKSERCHQQKNSGDTFNQAQTSELDVESPTSVNLARSPAPTHQELMNLFPLDNTLKLAAISPCGQSLPILWIEKPYLSMHKPVNIPARLLPTPVTTIIPSGFRTSLWGTWFVCEQLLYGWTPSPPLAPRLAQRWSPGRPPDHSRPVAHWPA